MLWQTLFLVSVAARQVAADRKSYIPVDYVENISESHNRIVSGWEATEGQHPHQVSLRMVDPVGTVGGCGGSIVSRQWVITSAHCTAARITVVVRAGLVSLTRPEIMVESTEYYNYPTFDSTAPGTVQPDDISLVKLPIVLKYSRNLQPIRIQPSADAHRDYNGEIVHASGFGRTWTNGPTTEVLRWVYLRAVSNPTCVAVFGSRFVTANTICARYFNVTSQSVCQGDSGGPLVHVNEEGKKFLVGVSSFVASGDFGCHSGFPAGFIRPGPFHSWFTEISGIDFENLNEDEQETTTAPTTVTTPTDRPTNVTDPSTTVITPTTPTNFTTPSDRPTNATEPSTTVTTPTTPTNFTTPSDRPTNATEPSTTVTTPTTPTNFTTPSDRPTNATEPSTTVTTPTTPTNFTTPSDRPTNATEPSTTVTTPTTPTNFTTPSDRPTNATEPSTTVTTPTTPTNFTTPSDRPTNATEPSTTVTTPTTPTNFTTPSDRPTNATEPSTTVTTPTTPTNFTTPSDRPTNATEPSTTVTTPTTPTTTTTTTPSPDDGDDDEEEEDDPELSELLKRLEVKVKVMVRLSKLAKKNKTIA